jgi:hypothetical protein
MILLVALLLFSHAVTGHEPMRFTDAQHGISFTYPRGYPLKRGRLGPQDTGLGYLGSIPMEFAGPGGIRIATVEAPRGYYPGTDFVNAFFSVSVNPFITRKECGQFRDQRSHLQILLVKTNSGRILHGVNASEAGLGHQASLEVYHTYSHGNCIELSSGLATAGYGAVDGMRQAPYRSIESQFKTILQSVIISNPESRRKLGAPVIGKLVSAISESPSHCVSVAELRRAPTVL